MAKIYNIENNQKNNVTECSPFEVKKQEEVKEVSPVYMEVLKIFKEAFSYVDITKIIKRL